jgi:hypothetical protein
MPSLNPPEYCGIGSLYDVLCLARQQPEVAAHLTWERRLLWVSDKSG